MFTAASSCFVEAVGSGTYLALDSVEDADNCQLLGIVIKKTYKTPFKADKYVPSNFTLQEILRKPQKGSYC